MASVMGICGGLVGPKGGKVEKAWFLYVFLRCQEGPEHASRANKQASRSVSTSKK